MSIKYKGQTISGPSGRDGTDGQNGVTFIPSVSESGDLSWTNNGGLSNPAIVNIKGPKGDKGDPAENTGEIYSTKEVRIGTWIDGRPLYRIVKKNSLNYPDGIVGDIYVGPEEQEIVNYIWIPRRADVLVSGNLYNDSSNYFAAWAVLPNRIGVNIPKNLSQGLEITLIIEYTKTTDPAQTLNLLPSNDTVDISTASSAKSELTAIKSTEQGKVM